LAVGGKKFFILPANRKPPTVNYPYRRILGEDFPFVKKKFSLLP
jgi:hypothetical protein